MFNAVYIGVGAIQQISHEKAYPTFSGGCNIRLSLSYPPRALPTPQNPNHHHHPLVTSHLLGRVLQVAIHAD